MIEVVTIGLAVGVHTRTLGHFQDEVCTGRILCCIDEKRKEELLAKDDAGADASWRCQESKETLAGQ